ncbi:MAG: alpha/beta hydrolase [Thermodesulfobacteriota bacterium]
MKKAFVIVLLVLAVLVAALSAAALLGREDMALDAKARAKLPGAFLTLSQGRVHYELSGPEDGKPVVLVHGFSTPMFVWKGLAPYLAGKGFRVLRFDLYGRGLSDRPDAPYDADTYDRELMEIIRAAGLKTPVDVVGLSMGGAVSVNFCARHPNLVDRLVLIGPAGMPQKETVLMSLVKVPGLGEILMAGLGGFTIRQGAKRSIVNPELIPGFTAEFTPQTRYKGYKRAILRTLRNFPMFNLEKAYLTLGGQDRKVLLIWGEGDVIVPFENSRKVLSAVPQAKFVPVAGAGHMPQYEKPQEINPLIAAFLAPPPAPPPAGQPAKAGTGPDA